MTGKSIAQIKINYTTYSLRATDHGLERMKQRKISEYVVTGDILSLGKDRLLELQKQDKDIALIDTLRNIAIILQFQGNIIKVLTVINSSDIYVKGTTVIEKLNLREDL